MRWSSWCRHLCQRNWWGNARYNLSEVYIRELNPRPHCHWRFVLIIMVVLDQKNVHIRVVALGCLRPFKPGIARSVGKPIRYAGDGYAPGVSSYHSETDGFVPALPLVKTAEFSGLYFICAKGLGLSALFLRL